MKNISRVLSVATLLLLSACVAVLAGGVVGAGLTKSIVIILIIVLSLGYIKINIKPSSVKNEDKRLKFMYNGRELMMIFVWTFVFHIVIVCMWKTLFKLPANSLILYLVMAVLSEAGILINGFVRVFTTSRRLGVVKRVALILLWWVPVVNIILFFDTVRTVGDEYKMETEKNELNNVRKESEICATKYPLLMVHGVFFRDLAFFNYWGRVPKELIKNGARIFYGEQQSAASVANSAAELKQRIEEIIAETGCEKVNIIAHSKGGLDSRYAISCLGMNKYVASLTTVNTPHRGCAFADYLLEHAPSGLKELLAAKYNSALIRLGDQNPDFIAAVRDLTVKNCAEINKVAPDVEGIYYQSVGSKMKNRKSAGFPLNVSYLLVKIFSKEDNDGLVDTESMRWGSRHIFFAIKNKRGLSHGDMIDLMREDIQGFDVREEFVKIVADLKSQGY